MKEYPEENEIWLVMKIYRFLHDRQWRCLQQLAMLLLLAFGWSIKGIAQLYPVQITPQLIAPYTANIPDYYSGTTEKLAVLLVNTDLTKPFLKVRLKMHFKSSSIELTSRDDVYYPAIDLDNGTPQRITLSDLAPYFDANNLIFSGMTRAQYEQTRKLPEGFYQVSFDAYEYYSGRLVGHSNPAMAWISLLDVPFLNLPRKAESIAYKDPTNIIFQWTPRSLGNPTAAFNTEYEFTLVELWDNGVSPEAAFGSSQPLYRTTTQTTTLLYGPSEPLLIPGKRYGWRVKAQASDGSQNSNAYKNNGYSEIYWFTYQRDCPTPFNVQCDVSGGRATITWNTSVQQNRYTVDYREKNQSGSTWYTVNGTTNRVMLYDLQKGKQYEYRVGGYCDLANGNFPLDGAVYTDTKTFALDGSTKDDGQACGILQPELKIANRTPIQSLLSGEVITAGDFPVKLINVQGNGNFTGNGYITIPFLGKVAVKVKFSNITVNTDKQLIGGLIETTYDASEAQIVSVDELSDDVKGIANDIANFVKMTVDKDAKDIAKLTQAIKQESAQEMPEALRQKTNTALDAVNAAKKEYDEAKQAYDNATTPQEKEDAQKKLEAASTQYNKAMDDVKAVQKEQSDWMQQTTDIIVKAIKSLKKDYDSKAADVSGTFAEKEKGWNDYMQKALQSLTGKPSLPQSSNGKKAIMLSIEDDNTANANDDMTGNAKAYKEAELQNNKVNTIAVFDRDISNQDYYKLLQQVFKVNGKSLVAYFKERKDAGDTEAQLINNIKTALDSFIGELLTK